MDCGGGRAEDGRGFGVPGLRDPKTGMNPPKKNRLAKPRAQSKGGVVEEEYRSFF